MDLIKDIVGQDSIVLALQLQNKHLPNNFSREVADIAVFMDICALSNLFSLKKVLVGGLP